MSKTDSTSTIAKSGNAIPHGARVEIRVGDGELHRWTDEAWAALMADNARDPRHPKVLLHGSDLVRYGDGRLVAFDAASLKEQLSRVAVFTSGSDDDGEPRPVNVPHDVALALLARTRDEYGPGAPVVDVMTDVPLVAADGTIVSEPGFWPEHGIYYVPAPELADLKIPERGHVEGPEELDAAKDFLLNDWFGEFGFQDEASRTNAIAALLTVFVSPFIGPGGSPLIPIEAPQHGWGKSTVTDACFMPGNGTVPKAPGVSSEEEMEKRITAKLRTAPSVIVIDNFTGHFDSAALANVLTTGVWEGRILGKSDVFHAEPRCVWTINGNGFTMSAELIERSPAPIVLGPGAYWDDLCERKGWNPGQSPRNQDKSLYRHPEYRKWATANRARAVEAAFVLIRHWLDGPAEVIDGPTFYRPEAPDGGYFDPIRPKGESGEFTRWRRTVGGILEAAGITGLGDNYKAWSTTTDAEGEEVADFLAAWRGLNLEPISAKTLEGLFQMGQPLYDVEPNAVASGPAASKPARLKAWLRDHKEASYRGYKIVVETTAAGRPNLYSVRGGA